MPTAVYCRISQDREGTEVGVENQRRAAEKALAKAGLEAPSADHQYVDNNRGASVRSRKLRPDFARLLADASAGRITDIAAYSWSRLTRRPKEFELLIDLAEMGVRFHLVNFGNFDLSTPDGRAVARTVAAWDAAEAERTGERVAFAQRGKLAKGEDTGGPRPFGFEKDRTTIRQAEAKVLRAAYGMVLEGATLYAVTQMFTASGLKRDRAKDSAWRPQTIRHILLRERNVGRLVVKGVTYSESLPALIDADTFEKVRAILTNPNRRPRRGPKPRTWAAVGIVRCGVCGGYLSQSGVQRNGKRNLRCAPDGRPENVSGMTHPTMEAVKLDRALSELVRVRLTPSSFSTPDPATPSPIAGLRVRLAELVRERDVIQDLASAPGANVPEAKKKISALGVKIDAAQLELDSALAVDVTSAAVDAALAVMVARDELDEWDPEADFAATSAAWDSYWSGLSVEDRRALIVGLGMRPLLWPRTAPTRLTDGSAKTA